MYITMPRMKPSATLEPVRDTSAQMSITNDSSLLFMLCDNWQLGELETRAAWCPVCWWRTFLGWSWKSCRTPARVAACRWRGTPRTPGPTAKPVLASQPSDVVIAWHGTERATREGSWARSWRRSSLARALPAPGTGWRYLAHGDHWVEHGERQLRHPRCWSCPR